MNNKLFFIYLLIIAGSTYLIRVIPFDLIKDKIKNKYINSFLHYIPYTVLASMTFPASFYATGHIITAVVGLVVSLILALKKCSLTIVAMSACVAVFISELILKLFM